MFIRLRQSLKPDQVNTCGGRVKRPFYKLILVTQLNNNPIDVYLSYIESCLKQGITSVQLREKNVNCGRVLTFARKLKSLLSHYEVPLIINDHLWLALEVEADGIHIGQNDMSPIEARGLLGSDKIIGFTVDSPEQLDYANFLSLNYVGVGALYPTSSKKDVKQIWSHSLLKEILPSSRHPVVGIGGINISNLEDVAKIGFQGVAMIQGLHPPYDLSQVVKKVFSYFF